MEAMVSAAPDAMGERSRSRTVRFSVRTQPLSSYRLPSVSEIGVDRTQASEEAFCASRRSDFPLVRVTAGSGAATPRTTVHPLSGVSKELVKTALAPCAAKAAKSK